MPQKINRAGELQNYVPAGNGDASGEYGDKSTGSNKNFKSFEKPKGDSFEIDEDNKKTQPIKKKVYTYTAWYSKTPMYVTKEEYERMKKNRTGYSSDKFEELEFDYDEKQLEEVLLKKARQLLEYDTEARFVDFTRISYNGIDYDAQAYFFHEHPEFLEKFKKVRNDIITEKNKLEIEKGKQALEKLPKIKGDISIDENIAVVNKSNYDKTSTEYYKNSSKDNYKEYAKYHYNCQKCAQAFELRMRGYDVEALARPEEKTNEYNDLLNKGWHMSMYVEPPEGYETYGYKYFFGKNGRRSQNTPFKSKRGATQREEIKKIVSDAGDGARFQCCVAWQDNDSHVFNIINDEGNVKFIDAQSGKEDVSYYFDSGMIKPMYTMIVRTDKLEINEYVNNIVKGK